MQFPVAAAGKGKVAIGCFAAATHEVIDVTDCAIQKEGNNAIVAVVRQWMKDFKIPAYDEDARTGIVRHIMGRVGVHTGEIMVCLVTACDMVPHMKDLVQRLRRDIPGLTSVVQNVNKRHTNVILGPKTKTVYGKGTIHDSIGPLTFHISAQSFFQVNSEQAQRLYEQALDFADLKGGETVADVLEYVQYDPKHLVRRLESWVSGAVKDGKITTEEGKEFISNYRAGLYGYTYLE